MIAENIKIFLIIEYWGKNMKVIRLGKSELKVSALGLGCVDFGSHTDEKTSFKLMDTYVENGGNLFDTANCYIFWDGFNGNESEKTIGKWFDYSGRRKDVILATKIGAQPKDNASLSGELLKENTFHAFSNMQGLSRTTVLEAVEKSLENLRTDYIDLLYLHVDDYSTPMEETLDVLNELIQKGLVKEIGCSNFRTWRVESARNICRQNGYKFFCAVQQKYSYLSPVLDADFFPQVVADKGLNEYINYYKDITMVAHTPLLQGMYGRGGVIDQEEYDTLYNRRKLNKLLEEEEQPASWVLKHITEQFGGSVVLSTTSNIKHLIENMKYIG